MKIAEGIKLIEEIVTGGNKIQVEPIVQEESIGIRIIVAIDYLDKPQLKTILSTSKEYNCEIYVKGDKIIYE